MVSLDIGKKEYPAWAESVICFALFALTLPLCFWFSRIGFDPHHSGLMLKTAVDVAGGQVLFAGSFTQYGALVAWIQALFVKWMGTSVTSILFATSLFYALSYTLLYRMARRFLRLPLALLTTLISVFLAPFYFWEFHPWSSVYALFFLLLSLLSVFHVWERKSAAGRLVAAGLSGFFAAMTFWCRQPAGIVAVLAGVLVFVIPAIALFREKVLRNRHLWHLAAFALGATLGVVLLLIPIWATHATADFVTQSICGMFAFAGSRSHMADNGFIGAVGILLANLFTNPIIKVDDLPVLNVMWSLLPVTVLVLAVIVIVRICRDVKDGHPGETARHMPLLAYTLFAGCAWHQYYPVSCYRHWYWGSFLCVPAVFLLLHILVERLAQSEKCKWLHPDKNRTTAFALALALMFAPNVGVRMVRGTVKSLDTGDMVQMEHDCYDYLNGVYLAPEVALYYTDLFDTMQDLQTRFPDKNVVNLTENGINAVFGENFHPMFINTDDFYYADYPAARDAYIAEERPIVIGNAAPSEEYYLYRTLSGQSGDPFEESHKLPANIYLPVECAGD